MSGLSDLLDWPEDMREHVASLEQMLVAKQNGAESRALRGGVRPKPSMPAAAVEVHSAVCAETVAAGASQSTGVAA